MTLPTAALVTTKFLYGQDSIPSNLLSSDLIRTSTLTTNPFIPVSTQEFMTVGGGRFAIGRQFTIVNDFFTADSSILPAGTYTKEQIGAIFGLSYYGWTMQQYNYQDGTDDYAERSYIYNTVAFKLSDNVRFVVDTNGSRHINNFGVIPDNTVQENFDFNGGGLATIVNPIIKDAIDPSRIGRKVNINFTDDVFGPGITYDGSSYFNDLAKMNSWSGLDLTKLTTDVNALVDSFWSGGVTKFLDSDERPIIYGTDDADTINSTTLLQTIRYATLAPYASHGVVLIGGTGNDILTGGLGDDKFIINTGDGIDTILDREVGDRIMFNGTALEGVATSLGNGKYSLNGATLQQSGLDLLITKDDTTGALVKEFFPTGYKGTEIISKIGITIPGVNITGNNFKYYYGTEGNDFQNIVGGPNIIFGMGGDDRIYVSQYASYIDGGDGNDTIYGGSNTDTIIGGAGNDIIFSGAGADTINAGEGNDQIVSGAGGQTIDGGGGTNTIDYSSSITGVIVNLALATAQSGGAYSYATGDILSNIQKIIGTNSVDTFIGDANDNVFTGGGGADTINGGDGIDFISYATSSASVNVNLALTTAQSGGHAAGDLLSNIENLTGSSYNDTLFGNALANIISGGIGKDTMTGGAGADMFKYSAVTDSGATSGVRDIITDFVEGTDKIDLGDFAGDFAFRGTSGFTEGAGVNYAQVASNTIIGIDADGNGILDFQIELTGLHTLAAGDFLL